MENKKKRKKLSSRKEKHSPTLCASSLPLVCCRPSFTQLTKFVMNTYVSDLDPRVPPLFEYLDEEGDLVRISSDVELEAAIKLCVGMGVAVLKVSVRQEM